MHGVQVALPNYAKLDTADDAGEPIADAAVSGLRVTNRYSLITSH